MSNTSTYQNTQAGTPASFPPQHQNQQPGNQQQMNPKPITDNPQYKGSGKLSNRVAIITGGDSGIGQAVSIAFAKEGADIVVVYNDNDQDANDTLKIVESTGRKCLLVKCDLRDEKNSAMVIDKTIKQFKNIHVLVNNIAISIPQNSISDISAEQLNNTFATNVSSYFFMVKAAMPHLEAGSSIINTTSVAAYLGNETLIDYSATKGAIVSYTRSLSQSLAKNGIRVNAVAPGPVWTPLIPASYSPQQVAEFGKNVPLGRAAQPFELAPAYVYFASDDSAYVTGQVLHVNGGSITES